VLFAAVQGKLAAQAVARRCRLRGSPALLTGRIFDDGGNRMSPTHANKGGVRYRYYISQALLQNKPQMPGSVSRVPAAELEALVVAALRNDLTTSGAGQPLPDNDRDLVERHLERVTVTANEIKLRLREIVERAFDFPDAARSLFDAVAELTGLMPLVRELEAWLEAVLVIQGRRSTQTGPRSSAWPKNLWFGR
jgi:hypothetical protein